MTKKNALTKWFIDLDPVRDGVYEVEFLDGGFGFSRFENGTFHYVGFTDMLSRLDAFRYALKTSETHERENIVRWRGLASDPKVTA